MLPVPYGDAPVAVQSDGILSVGSGFHHEPVQSHKLDDWFCNPTHVPGDGGGSLLGVLNASQASLSSAICISRLRSVQPHCLSTMRCQRVVSTPSHSCLTAVNWDGDLSPPLNGVLRDCSRASAILSVSRLPPLAVLAMTSPLAV